APARPTAPPSGPPRDAADLRARTLALLQDRALLQASVEQCRFDGPDANGRVVVTLQSERKLHHDRLASPVIQQELTQVVRTAAAADVQVEFRFGGAGAAPAAGGKPQPQAAPGPAAVRVVEAFRGRIVQVNPDDRPRRAPAPGGDEPTDEATDGPPPPVAADD
ncbi:MAG: hypothetical protein JNL08_12380, partial [Planctomycetes bacterium]|nr:hypothetical protein [Planctomycetota bacterium]